MTTVKLWCVRVLQCYNDLHWTYWHTLLLSWYVICLLRCEEPLLEKHLQYSPQCGVHIEKCNALMGGLIRLTCTMGGLTNSRGTDFFTIIAAAMGGLSDCCWPTAEERERPTAEDCERPLAEDCERPVRWDHREATVAMVRACVKVLQGFALDTYLAIVVICDTGERLN